MMQNPPRTFFKPTGQVFLLLVMCFLGGCEPAGLESDLKQYNNRLARVLEQPLVEGEAIQRLVFPRVRLLQQPIEPIKVDLLDFLQLGDCELQQVVAEKNSSLGRFAPTSRLLAQDVLFISLAEACRQKLAADGDLTALLQAAVAEKRRTLGKRLWNATLAGPEYRLFWQIDLANYPEQIDSRVDPALRDIESVVVALGEDQWDADLQVLEVALEVLRNGEAGALVESWRHVATSLAGANRLLQARAARRPLCFPGMSNPKADIFHNIVLRDFIQGIQGDVAILNRRYYDIVIPIRRIEEMFRDVETQDYRRFRLDRDRLLETARGSVALHVAALEPLMVQCGFLPGVSHE